jgi:hypothetical protein
MRVMIGGALDRRGGPGRRRAAGARAFRFARDHGLRLAPEMVRIIRHHRGIPQYTLGHLDRLERIDTLLQRYPGLFVAGNSYRGVAINSCIAEAGGIADRVVASLGKSFAKPAA